MGRAAIAVLILSASGSLVATASRSGAGSAGAVAERPPAGVVGTDERQPLDTTDWPWSAIGRVNVAGRRFCTGTLIGPRHVLTAAHCLIHPRAKRILPHTIHFVAGYRRGAYLAHSVAEQVVCASDDICKASDLRKTGRWPPEDDWAIVVLRDPLGIRPLPLASAAGATSKVTRAGYGRDRAHLLSRHTDCALMLLQDRATLVSHDCDATQGDSGSPLLAGAGEDTVLAAMHVGHFGRGPTTRGLAIGAAAFVPALAKLLQR